MMSGGYEVGILSSRRSLVGILLSAHQAVNIVPHPAQSLQPQAVLLKFGPSKRLISHTCMTPQNRLITWTVFCILCCLLPMTAEARQVSYKVQGTVVAVTLNQTPPLIVVKTPLGPKNHMTVGATVTAHTKILRGNKRVALNTIREGEVVWLTYVKAPGGVLAEIIRVGA